MYLITVNELEQRISKMKEIKANFVKTTEMRPTFLQQQSAKGLQHFTDFMEQAITYLQLCENTVAARTIELEQRQFEQFIQLIFTTGDRLNHEMGVYLQVMKQVEQAFEQSEVPKESIGEFVHTMEHTCFAQLNVLFYEFIIAYNEGVSRLLRYLEKIENKFTKK